MTAFYNPLVMNCEKAKAILMHVLLTTDKKSCCLGRNSTTLC